jgi:hypothetical protein
VHGVYYLRTSTIVAITPPAAGLATLRHDDVHAALGLPGATVVTAA